jgi:cell division initiation protein
VRVSPLDIRKQVFKKVMRGADPEEVRMFLDVVASEYEKVIQDNAMMAERIRTLDARIAEFRALEENMRNSLVMADRIATESRESSDREARRVVQDAHSRSERILEDARERLQNLVREIEMLRGKKEVFARRFWTLIEGQIGVLQEHMADTVEVESLRKRVSQLVADARSAVEEAAEELTARPTAPARAPIRPEDASAAAYRADLEPPASPRFEPDRAFKPDRGFETDRGSAFPDAAHGVSDVSAPRDVAPRLGAVPRPESAPRAADPSARRPVPRGLSRLLRGRQSSLPMNEPVPTTGTGQPGPVPANEELPEPERAEGFFEISASDARRRAGGPRFREDETGDRG